MTDHAPAALVHVRAGDTDLQSRDDAQGSARFRVLIDADGGPSSKLVQGLSVFEAADTEAAHSHDRPETAYVVSGGGTLTVGDEENQAEAGDVFFIPPGLVHSWRAGEEGLHVLFSFPGDRMSEVAYDWAEA